MNLSEHKTLPLKGRFKRTGRGRFLSVLLTASFLCACGRTPGCDLLPLPKHFQGGRGTVSARTVAARTVMRLVDSLPEAGRNVQEAYRLTVSRKGALLEAVTEDGLWNGLQTLRQLEDRGRYPVCTVIDWPSFRIRGFMQDCGRTWISPDELKREIDILSRYKINVFHWHLTENQAWRLESRIYPQLNAAGNMTRQPGAFYTQEEARDLVAFCRERHVTLIPEIDMPGHSAAFERALGFGMQTPQGKEALKRLLEEVCETFDVPWLHIGTDEAAFTDPSFVPEMVAHVRSLGKKVISWNPGWHYGPGEIDMTQLWSYRGMAQPGIPAIDCRLHYINHFDLFGDLIALHTSTVYGRTEDSGDIAGSILALWNDRYLADEEQIPRQNAFYPSLLALADRLWRGGGYQYFDDFGTVLPPSGEAREDFTDFERRMLRALGEGPLAQVRTAYVRQTDARWSITDPFPNGGDLEAVFPPEMEWAEQFTFDGRTYRTRTATGSGIYLRHVWGPGIVAGFLENPQPDHTVYARARVRADRDMQVGLLFETQNYSRSERDPAPPEGAWDRRHSWIRINGEAVPPPAWAEDGGFADADAPLGNENAAGRPPIPVTLRKGWNEVLVKLPVGAFSTPDTRLVKWMFTCAFTTPDGRQAADVRYE